MYPRSPLSLLTIFIWLYTYIHVLNLSVRTEDQYKKKEQRTAKGRSLTDEGYHLWYPSCRKISHNLQSSRSITHTLHILLVLLNKQHGVTMYSLYGGYGGLFFGGGRRRGGAKKQKKKKKEHWFGELLSRRCMCF